MISPQYSAVGHITGIHAATIDLASKLPWLYTIVSVGSRVIYIGETHAEEGLVGRLSQHFGRFTVSTLKQRAEEVASIRVLRPPFLVVAARLPLEDDAAFDGSAKQVRLLCEAFLHQLVALQFLPANPDWTIVSTPTGSAITSTHEMEEACQSIYKCFSSIYQFLGPLSGAAPFQLVILEEVKAQPIPTEEDLGRLIEDIEMSLYKWMLERLQREYGDRWWLEGISVATRKKCVEIREDEAKDLPPEAYMTLIDLIDVAKKNWPLFEGVFEQISGSRGKDRGTQWIGELNESRKIWAHPIKRLFAPAEPARIMAVRTLSMRIKNALMNAS